ncbi:MAG: enzyme of heme biosynthesis [Methylobacter sp.]|nr:MAG: enzyme of heme biosynthesis [Methylobacter sp.]PPD23260.1 MAG: enzyme of heme biosynthesis [Methylobacter sp.]PPD37223.1 MAG: enzyme of heme biosynthesis [Methylomonas sp.]
MWVAIIILFLILSLAGAGFYLFSLLRQEQADLGGELNKGDMQVIELSKLISGYQTQLSAMQAQLASLEGNIAGKDNSYGKKLEDFSKLHSERLETTQKQLGDSIQQLQRQLGKTRGDWLVADAEYLLNTANERLNLIGDINTTKEALLAADQRLRESGDAAAFKVREQIAKDLAALNSVSQVDIVGTYAVLQSLQEKCDHLALYLPYAGKEVAKPEPEVKAETKDENASPAEQIIDSALEQLEGIVTIRHTDQPIKAILTEEEAQFIREQLRVRLEMIKIALVQRNDMLYQTGIADAKQWLEHNYAKNAQAESFAQELKKLSGNQLRGQLPDISQSLKMLRDITKLRIETDKAMEPTGSKAEAPQPPAEQAAPEQPATETKTPEQSPANQAE